MGATRSILLLDDDERWRETTREMLSDTWNVYEAEDGIAASALIAKTRFDVVLADVVLNDSDRGRSPGDVWLEAHLEQLSTADKYLVTGFDGRIRRSGEDLQRLGIHVIQKGATEETELYERLLTPSEDWRHRSPPGEAEPDPGAAVGRAARRLFATWLGTLPGDRGQALWLDGVGYGPAELSREVAQGTPAGDFILTMLLDDLTARLRGGRT